MKTNRRNPFSRPVAFAFVSLAFSASSALAADKFWDLTPTPASNLWATAGNWSTTSGADLPDPAAAPGTSDVAIFNNASSQLTIDVGTANNSAAKGSTTFASGAGAYIIGSSTAQIYLMGTGAYTINMNSAAANDQTFNAKWQLGGSGSSADGTYNAVNNSTTNKLVFAGGVAAGAGGTKTVAISGAGAIDITSNITKAASGSVNVTKSGTGTLTLSGTNNYNGGLTLNGVSAGQLNLNSASALGTGTFTVNSGNLGKIDNTSGAALTLANSPQQWDANFTFVGTNDLNMGTGAVTMSGSRTITSSTAGKTLTLGGVISGSGFSLTKAGAGNLTLTGANAYTGGTLITGGRLILNRVGGPAIKGNVSLSTSTNNVRPILYLQADNQLESTATISATLGGSNSVFTDLVLAGHSQTIAGYAASGRPTTTARSFIQNGIITGDAGAGVLTINNSSTVTLGGGTIANQLEIRDNNGVGGGTLALVKDGNGTLVLNLYAASYTGGFTLNNGLVQVAGTAFGSGTPLIFQGGTLSSSDTTARTFASGNTVSLAADVTLGNALNNGKLTFPGAATLTDNRTLTINSTVEFSGGTDDGGTAKSLTKVGPGSLILGGTNTYTGDTNINAGRLDIAGSLTSNVTVAANTTIGGEGSISAGSTLTFSPGSNTLAFDPTTSGGLSVPAVNITGATILVSPDSAVTATSNYLVLTNSSGFGATVPPEFKAATRGTLSLANANTELRFTAGSVQNLAWRGYAGPNQTLWNIDGTANWDNSGSADKFFNLDTVVFDDNAINTVVQITGSSVSPEGVITFNHSTKNYTLGSSGSYGIATGNLIKTGTGTLTITNSNAYDGGTLLEDGTININNADAIGSPAGALTFDSTLASGTPVPTLQLGATIPGSSRGIVLTTDGYIDTNGYDLTQTGVVSGESTLTKSGAGILTLGAGNSYSGATVITGGTVSIATDSNLGTAPVSPTPDKIVLSNGGKLSVSGSGATINANRLLTLNGTGGTLEATGTNNLIYRGIVTGSGALTLSMTGSGEGQFGNASSDYSGGTIIAAGSKIVFFNSSSGSASTSDLTNGDFGTGTITMNNVSLRPTTAGPRTIGNAITLQGDLTVYAPASDPKALTFDGPITLTGATRMVTNNSGAALTFSGVVSDGSNNLGLVKTGPNSLTLSNANTYGGDTTLQGTGSISLTHSQALGSGGLLLQSTQAGTATTLAISGGITVANPITMDSTTGRESITSSGTGNNALSGGITITGAGSNHLAISNIQASGSLTISGGINGAAYTGNVSLRGSLAGPNGFINGTITIASEFQQNGTTDWVVNCPGSTWTNTRLFGVGSILLGAENALATSAKVLWSAGATGALDLAGFNQTVAGLDAATVTTAKVTNNGATDRNLTLSGLAADYIYAGTITDGSTNKVSLEMNSAGRTQTLAGANTYSGATTITAGTLALGSTGSIDASTALTVAAGAELDTTAKTSQTLPATVTIGLDGDTNTSGLIDASGKDLVISGATVNFAETGTLTAPVYVLANYATITGTATFASVESVPGYNLVYNHNSGTQIALVKVTGSAYDTWASGFSLTGPNAAFDFDYDNDGLDNGLEWILGGDPTTSSTSKAPVASRNLAGDLVLTFTREENSITETTLKVLIGTDLATWPKEATVGATGSGPDANGVTVNINTAATPDAVTVTIPASNAASGKLFGRLKVSK